MLSIKTDLPRMVREGRFGSDYTGVESDFLNHESREGSPVSTIDDRHFPPGENVAWSSCRQRIRTYLYELPEDQYDIVKPIPVLIERDADEGWAAYFEEAEIGMPGSDPEDAKAALAYDVINALEIYNAEEGNLGPIPQKQLEVLRKHIRKKGNVIQQARRTENSRKARRQNQHKGQ